MHDAELAPDVALLVAPYLEAVRCLNPGGTLVAYPGSPLLAKMLIRSEDRLVKVLAVDGYSALPAQMPPRERRALVLIDPPFEAPGEFARMMHALKAAWHIFPQGVYALWYPLKDVEGVAGFKTALHESEIPDIGFSEFRLRAPSEPPRLFGSGMILVNPPYVLRAELDAILSALLPVLATSETASFENGIIRPE